MLWIFLRFINCSKRSTLVQDIDSGEGCTCMGAGGTWKVSVPSAQFCYELKTTLLKSLLIKKRKRLPLTIDSAFHHAFLLKIRKTFTHSQSVSSHSICWVVCVSFTVTTSLEIPTSKSHSALSFPRLLRLGVANLTLLR